MAVARLNSFIGRIPQGDYSRGVLAFPPQSGYSAGYFAGSTIMDPNRVPGHICPGPKLVQITDATDVDATVLKMVPFIGSGLDQRQYFIMESDEKILSATSQTNIANPVSLTSGDLPSDAVLYENNGTFELFVSYNDATNGNIARISTLTGTEVLDDDYYTAVLSGTLLNKNFPHPMSVAENGICYIGNGTVLASMDLRTGSPVQNDVAVSVQTGWIIKDHMPYKGFHFILVEEVHEAGATPSASFGRVAVLVWDYVATNFNDIYYLEDASQATTINRYKGVPIVFAKGSESKIYQYNGSGFTAIPRVSWSGGLPLKGGVTHMRGGLLAWHTGSDIRTLGDVYGRDANAHNIIMSVGGTGNVIAQSIFDSKKYFVGGVVSDTDKLGYIDLSIDGGYGFGDYISEPVTFGRKVKVTGLRFYYQTRSGGSPSADDKWDVSIIANENDSMTHSNIGDLSGSDMTATSNGYKEIPVSINDVHRIRVRLKVSANVAVNAYIPIPYLVEVVYEESGKH